MNGRGKRIIRLLTTLIVSVLLTMGITTAPASATTWDCYIEYPLFGWYYWSRCTDSPYHSGFSDSYGYHWNYDHSGPGAVWRGMPSRWYLIKYYF